MAPLIGLSYIKKFFTFGFLTVLALFQPSFIHAEKWDWEEISVEEKKFPKEFLWGSAVSEFQVSGAALSGESQWSAWEEAGKVHGGLSGNAADQWNRIDEDIQLMKELGLNSFRFSIEWSAVEPREGEFDQTIIAHYRNRCMALRKAGIEPMVTLHHFTHPLWFEKKGGFEKEENIADFVRFSKVMFENLSGECKLWCTINEPTVFAMMGYILGQFPPGKTSPQTGGEVLKNLLSAHVSVYKELKAMENGANAEIGLVHNYLVFASYREWNPIEKFPGYLLNPLNEQLLRFFKTGEFSYRIPVVADVTLQNLEAPTAYDFIGLNYYSRAVLKTQWSLSEFITGSGYDDEIMTDMPLAIYPQGLYEAIVACADLGKPIYITENGIADERDDRRGLFLHRYLYALSKAIKDGYDIRGYYYWSFVDNYEWDMGWTKKFGLYALDLETKERSLRAGAHIYKEIIQNSRS